MPSRHLLITGTGRAGTTALVELLGACGLETRADVLRYYPDAHAGLESSLRDENPPYVVKTPLLSEGLEDRIREGFDPSRIDGVVVPIRDLDQAAYSRIQRFVESRKVKTEGGLWRSKRPSSQKAELAIAVHKLLLTTAEHHVPVYFMLYPKFVDDAEYAYLCLQPVIPLVDRQKFLECHRSVMKSERIRPYPPVGRARMARLDALWAVRKFRQRG